MTNFSECIKYINELNCNAFSVFVGAGLSKVCGMPDWGELAKPYIKTLGISNLNVPYERIFQYGIGNVSEYSIFLESLKKRIYSCKPRAVHRLIARLNLPRIWTTNYDGILEQAYLEEGLSFQTATDDNDLYNLDFDSKQIIKMHGSLVSGKNDIVLLESQYENYIHYRPGLYQLFQNDIRSKSMLYLGFSFDDPNVRRIVSSIWNKNTIGKPSFLFTVPPAKEKTYYNSWKNDLSTRYGIIVIELQDYFEIETFMYQLLELRYGKTILLIGKRDDTKYNDLAYILGKKLAQAGYKIHCGGGPNIAKALASGAWDFLEKHQILIDDKITFFYRNGGGSTNPQKGTVLYYGNSRSEVRKRMISADKICVVMGDEEGDANGMLEEIEIAKTKGARIIPVGITGNTAKTLWSSERFHYDTIFSEKAEAFNMLNSKNATIDEITNSIIELADYLLVRNYRE